MYVVWGVSSNPPDCTTAETDVLCNWKETGWREYGGGLGSGGLGGSAVGEENGWGHVGCKNGNAEVTGGCAATSVDV